MTEAMALAWSRVRRWLEANASLARSRVAVQPEGVVALEQHLGFALPLDLVDHFTHALTDDSRRSALLPGRYAPLSPRGALVSSRIWREVAADLAEYEPELTPGPEEHVAGTFVWSWQDVFVPIAEDGSGNALFVDLREGSDRGCVMEYDHEQGALSEPWWPSVTAMAEDLATSLEAGSPCAGYAPRVSVAGELEWAYGTET